VLHLLSKEGVNGKERLGDMAALLAVWKWENWNNEHQKAERRQAPILNSNQVSLDSMGKLGQMSGARSSLLAQVS
jgi:hypothetical protein